MKFTMCIEEVSQHFFSVCTDHLYNNQRTCIFHVYFFFIFEE